jgi:hypothetical protein
MMVGPRGPWLDRRRPQVCQVFQRFSRTGMVRMSIIWEQGSGGPTQAALIPALTDLAWPGHQAAVGGTKGCHGWLWEHAPSAEGARCAIGGILACAPKQSAWQGCPSAAHLARGVWLHTLAVAGAHGIACGRCRVTCMTNRDPPLVPASGDQALGLAAGGLSPGVPPWPPRPSCALLRGAGAPTRLLS